MGLRVYTPRKVIGASMMIIGGAGLGLPVLFVLLAIADEQPVEFVVIVTGLLSLVAMVIWKPVRGVVPPLLLCLALGYFCYYRWFTAEGVLSGYGVYYDNDPDSPPFASSSLDSVRLWFEGSQGRLPGPTLFGDMIYVERPYRNSDGHLEFVVRSSVSTESATQIELLFPPEGKMAFRVMKDLRLHVTYSLQPDLPLD